MVSRIQQKGNQHPIFGAAFGFYPLSFPHCIRYAVVLQLYN